MAPKKPYELIQGYIWWTPADEEPTLLGRGIAGYDYRESCDGTRLECELSLTVRCNRNDPLPDRLLDALRHGDPIHLLHLIFPVKTDAKREFASLRLREVPILEQREEPDGTIGRYVAMRFTVGVVR